MHENKLFEGTLYKTHDNEFYIFSRMGSTGRAILHPPTAPDMQSCVAVDPHLIDRPATYEEVIDVYHSLIDNYEDE